MGEFNWARLIYQAVQEGRVPSWWRWWLGVIRYRVSADGFRWVDVLNEWQRSAKVVWNEADGAEEEEEGADQSASGCFAFSLRAAPAHASEESLLESWCSSQCAAGGWAPQIRAPCVYRTERGRNRRREWERGIVALHNGPANIPVSPSLAPWACACVGAADCTNEGWEKKGIGKGRGQGYNGWEGLKIPPYVTHTWGFFFFNIRGQNHVRMIQLNIMKWKFCWRIQSCSKRYCKFAIDLPKEPTPQILV